MSKDRNHAACLIVGYSRLEGTLRVADAATRNGCKKIYLSLDGPIDQTVFAIQEKIKAEFIKICERRNSEYEIRSLSKNVGLKSAVISGIDWFFEKEEEGFVLEDDLDISDSFFDYVDSVHGKFKDDSKILLISGNQFEKNLDFAGPMLSAYPLIWGWFTNAERWNVIKNLINGVRLAPKQRLPLSVEMFWKIGALKSRTGITNSWAVPFAEGFRFQGYRCIVPSVNLISNVGTDRFAIHTKSFEAENSYPIDENGAKIFLSNKSGWDYSQQDPTYLEKNIYRIKPKHALLWFKLLYFNLRGVLAKKPFDRNKNSSIKDF